GVNFHKTTRRGWKRTWNISVYNVYNQLNPFFVYPSSKTEQTGPSESRSKTVLKQVSIFPVLPSVTYVVRF
ncbi:MAG TPA: hypothetical protein DC016_05635, partial [Porphyromonadaceae bacterium]|nr:hypothetical protein [Porphyromonadaceae bacterium]